ncbi:hypothetical protein CTA2_9656, partial [Colletotrichum tanaceti]
MATHGGNASATTAKEHTGGHGSFQHDVEMGAPDAHLLNTTVHSVSWDAVEVTVKDRETKNPK